MIEYPEMLDYPEGWVKPTKEELEVKIEEYKPYFPTVDDIENLLYNYRKKIEKLKTSYKNKEIDISKYYADKDAYELLFAQAIKLLFSQEVGDIFLVEDFIAAAKSGGFIPYDGSGCFIHLFGKEVGYINWSNLDDYPDEAVFVSWYNK